MPLLFLAAALLTLLPFARTQDAVNFLTATTGRTSPATGIHLPANTQTFDFADNLVRFEATLDGSTGDYILDTGAPEVLLNDRGSQGMSSLPSGLAAGGSVHLADRFISSFEFSGVTHRRLQALSLDLRPVEERLGRPVDGFVGFSLLQNGELRIDYRARTFQLLKSVRKPRHLDREPDFTYRLELYDHLPVITVKVNGKKLRFALDTGSSVNLLDRRHADLARATGKQIDLQGLDGEAFISDQVTFPPDVPVSEDFHDNVFALFDLDGVHAEGDGGHLSGILGSAFLSRFTVGIDYPRRRVYLWQRP